MESIETTDFWQKLMKGIYGPREGGARIIIDAENAATGVGKTSLAVGLGLLLSRAFDYELQEEDLTLSGKEYLQRWREHPGKEQPSVLILDELSGAGAADTRRAMSTSNVQLGRSWETMRSKRCVTLTTLPHWSNGDSKLQQLSDYRLWCLEEPIGYFIPYKVGTTFTDGEIRTKRLDDRLCFPDLTGPDPNPLYESLADEKMALHDSQAFDADALAADGGEQQDPDEAQREQKVEDAQRARDAGLTCDKAAEVVGMSKSWVSRHTESRETDSKQ